MTDMNDRDARRQHQMASELLRAHRAGDLQRLYRTLRDFEHEYPALFFELAEPLLSAIASGIRTVDDAERKHKDKGGPMN